MNMERKNIFKALAAFQQEVPTIHKATQGYGYSYADLPAILEVINPLLAKHGLGFTQPINGDVITTVVFHCESGEHIKSETRIPQGVSLKGMNDFQVLGSAITYLRRYALSSILGLVTDKDTDAAGVQQQSKQDPLQEWRSCLDNIKDIESLGAFYSSNKETVNSDANIMKLFTQAKNRIENATNA